MHSDPLDFSATEQTFFFSASTSRACLQIPIIDDSAVENPEDFLVLISSSDPNVNVSLPMAATVIILDNDRTTIGFERESYTVGEDAGFVEVCVSILEGSLEFSVEVSLSTIDSSAKGDYALRVIK